MQSKLARVFSRLIMYNVYKIQVRVQLICSAKFRCHQQPTAEWFFKWQCNFNAGLSFLCPSACSSVNRASRQIILSHIFPVNESHFKTRKKEHWPLLMIICFGRCRHSISLDLVYAEINSIAKKNPWIKH
jgi:hypothetical protein